MEIWNEYYHWEVEFENTTINELEEQGLEKQDRVDFGDLSKLLGKPLFIRLIPHQEGFQQLTVNLDGANPVYFRRNVMDLGMNRKFYIFFIGKNTNGFRRMIGVNSSTKEVILEEDIQ